MTNDLVSNLITTQQNLSAHYVSGVGDLRAISTAFDEANSALRAELGRLQKVEFINKATLDALKAIRPWMIPGMNWSDEVGQSLKNITDAAIHLAEGEDHANQS